MKKEDFQPGQTVYLLEQRFMPYEYRVIEKRIKEAKVLSVGRKYITVERGIKIKFDIANDFREVTNYSINWNLFLSKEDIKKLLKRREMEKRVETAFHFPNHVSRKLTFEELQTVYEIVGKHYKY